MRRLIREFVVLFLVGWLALGIAEAQTPPECKIAKLTGRATRLSSNCDPTGSYLLRVIFLREDGTQIDPQACGIGPVQWCVGETWSIFADVATGHRAWVRDLQSGETARTCALIYQDGERKLWLKTLVYE